MKKIALTCTKTAMVLLLSLVSFTAFSQNPFTCTDGVSYLVKTTGSTSTLFRVSLVPVYSETSLGIIRTSGNANILVDAIGYNVVDNFIYGFEPGTTNIVKIGSGGISERLSVTTGLPGTSAGRQFTAGDVDANGNLFLYASDATSMYRVNLNVQPYAAVAITGPAASLRDISVNDAGTQVYGYHSTGGALTLRTISGSTYTQSYVSSNVPTAVQNTFYDKYDRLFAQKTNGEIFMVTPGSSWGNTDGMVKLWGNAPPASSDGAHCRNASVYDETAQPRFDCNQGNAYFITHGGNGDCYVNNNNTNLATVNTQNFSRTSLTNITQGIQSGLINGIGFNPKDGYIWGYRLGTGHLARIGSDGSVQYFAIPGLLSGCGGFVQNQLGAADITTDGIYYGYQGTLADNNNKLLYKIDLNPASPTYLTILNVFTATPPPVATQNINIADIAFNPVDKNLYGVGDNKNVYRINPATGAVTNLGRTSFTGDIVVATFCDPAGDFYFQSVSAPLYKIPRVHNTSNLTAIQVSTGQIGAGNGDAARCPLAFFAGITLSGNVWDDINADRIKSGGELNTVTDDPSETLTIYLINSDNVIVGKADVQPDGTWTMPTIPAGSYTLALSNDASHDVSSPGTAVVQELPDYWVHTGINFGTAGPVGSWNGPVTVSVSDTEKSNLNFGIRNNAAVVSGTVFTDANGDGNIDPTESGSNIGSADLTAYLVDNNGIVIDKVAVDPTTGAYSLTGAQGSTYTVVLSNNPSIAEGSPAPPASLPNGGTMPYENTREAYGTGNGSGTGLDPIGTPGVIAVTLTGATVTGVNFGVNSTPVANNVDNPGLLPSDFSSSPPESFPTVENFVSIPYQGLLPMNGDDREDGDLEDQNNTVTVTSVNSNTLLHYDNGTTVIPVTAGTVIENFDPANLVIYGAIGSGDASNPLGFTYTLVDAAGAESTPAIYTLSSSSALPVKLISFSVTSESTIAKLTWSTSEEANSDKFDVQHSLNGNSWASIGSVAAKGESNGMVTYHFTHEKPANGVNLYRLKMIDIDGKFAFSKIISAHLALGLDVSIFPNPTSDLIKVKIGGADMTDVAKVEMYAQSGAIVYKAGKLERGEINLSGIPSGTYVLVVTLKNGTTRNAKIVVAR